MKKGPTFREYVERPLCPFCGREFAPPRELVLRRPLEMPVGACSCGAVYAYDASGKNLGSAFIEALVFACNMDWDLAWGLLPQEDYQEKIVENYDWESHLIVPGGCYQGRRVRGALYFVRLCEDVREVTLGGVERLLQRVTVNPRTQQAPSGVSVSKKELEAWVREYRAEEVVCAVARDKKALWHLKRLLAAGEEEVRLRAAEMLGRAVALIAGQDPGRASELLKSFLYALEDTGSFSLGVVDALGEIIARSPERFAGYLPPLVNLLAMPVMRGRALRALSLVAESRPDLLRKFARRITPYLADPEPTVRGYAARLLGLVGAAEAREDLWRLQGDTAGVPVYNEGQIYTQTVGQLAREALENLQTRK